MWAVNLFQSIRLSGLQENPSLFSVILDGNNSDYIIFQVVTMVIDVLGTINKTSPYIKTEGKKNLTYCHKSFCAMKIKSKENKFHASEKHLLFITIKRISQAKQIFCRLPKACIGNHNNKYLQSFFLLSSSCIFPIS